jgi:hypothetical protein
LKLIVICILSIIDPDNPPVDVADGTKFIIKNNVDVIKVGKNNEQLVYEVHSQQCTGFLNEKEINKKKIMILVHVAIIAKKHGLAFRD